MLSQLAATVLRTVRSRSMTTFRGPYQSPEKLTSDMSMGMKAGIVGILGASLVGLAKLGAPTMAMVQVNPMDVDSPSN
eukprot:m.13920 g.13920  ORF g.13920 m.13920 type:complete len:78 (+) comp10245_c0_seq1:67-300(+)